MPYVNLPESDIRLKRGTSLSLWSSDASSNTRDPESATLIPPGKSATRCQPKTFNGLWPDIERPKAINHILIRLVEAQDTSDEFAKMRDAQSLSFVSPTEYFRIRNSRPAAFDRIRRYVRRHSGEGMPTKIRSSKRDGRFSIRAPRHSG